jgi:hypothetical protein
MLLTDGFPRYRFKIDILVPHKKRPNRKINHAFDVDSYRKSIGRMTLQLWYFIIGYIFKISLGLKVVSKILFEFEFLNCNLFQECFCT